jgi:hypothetical protein
MRTSLLGVMLAAALSACTVGTIAGTGGGSGGSKGSGPGSGSDPGSGSNPGSGSDPGSGSNSSTPMLSASIDKSTLSTELKTSNQFTISLAGSGGYTGSVALAAEVVDTNSQAIKGWTVTLNEASMAFTGEDATQNVTATLAVPSSAGGTGAMLAGTLNVTVTPAGQAAQTLSSAITLKNQVTYVITGNGGNCVYPTGISQTTPDVITVGTNIVFANMAGFTLVVHSNGATDGVLHEDLTGITNGQTYEQQLTGSATGLFSWYCHSPGPDNGTSDPFIKAQ